MNVGKHVALRCNVVVVREFLPHSVHIGGNQIFSNELLCLREVINFLKFIESHDILFACGVRNPHIEIKVLVCLGSNLSGCKASILDRVFKVEGVDLVLNDLHVIGSNFFTCLLEEPFRSALNVVFGAIWEEGSWLPSWEDRLQQSQFIRNFRKLRQYLFEAVVACINITVCGTSLLSRRPSKLHESLDPVLELSNTSLFSFNRLRSGYCGFVLEITDSMSTS